MIQSIASIKKIGLPVSSVARNTSTTPVPLLMVDLIMMTSYDTIRDAILTCCPDIFQQHCPTDRAVSLGRRHGSGMTNSLTPFCIYICIYRRVYVYITVFVEPWVASLDGAMCVVSQ